MGSVRGVKKRRKTEKKIEQNGSVSSDREKSADWWVDFSKRIHGHLSPSKGLHNFESIFKISRNTFDYICSLVKEDIIDKPGSYNYSNGRPIPLNDQVAIALRRLSSGDSLLNIGDAFGLNHSTVSQLTWRFVELMEKRALHHLHWPSEEGMTDIKSKFEKFRGFPNCCGAIDTTHIAMCLALAEPTTKVWFDRERNHSMLLQAIVDPDMKFRDIVTGWPGKMSDSLVLESSTFFQMCEKGKRLCGKKVELLDGSEVGEYIVGDSGFPLLPWLITPYTGKDLEDDSKAEFNRRHFATRMVAQRALTRLKEMWKIMDGVMWRPDKHKLPRIVLVCCLLHNIVIDLEDDIQDEMTLSLHHDSGYRQQVCESADKTAVALRDNLRLYLSERRIPPS
ncbi:hypothetical protein Droror1_Dr00004338 [Drosera rotundifolia]